jgi:hypothetical protein
MSIVNKSPKISIEAEVSEITVLPGETLTVWLAGKNREQIELRVFPNGYAEVWTPKTLAVLKWEKELWTPMPAGR